ncbi:MAG: metallophosphoesterase [Terriglobales bacterium]|jgi:acid phosphatase type 7
MLRRREILELLAVGLIIALAVALLSAASPQPDAPAVRKSPIELHPALSVPFKFIAYGDTRFTDPADTDAANAQVRQALVRAIADAQSEFVLIGGDITYRGAEAADWQVYDKETAVWREKKLTVLPVLGNHDLKGKLEKCLANYFQRFPVLEGSRYYSIRAANVLMFVLDSSEDEATGPQGEWLKSRLNDLSKEIDFVIVVLHHPPYTSSSDEKLFGGGHSARPREKELAELLETTQEKIRPRVVLISSHVHNYERQEHGGVTYFVTGGGGAHAYPIERKPSDLFQSHDINYHYISVEVDHGKLKATMNRLVMQDGRPIWTQPDTATIVASR